MATFVVVPSLDFYKPFFGNEMNQQTFSDLQFRLYDKDFMNDGGIFFSFDSLFSGALRYLSFTTFRYV